MWACRTVFAADSLPLTWETKVSEDDVNALRITR